MKLIDKDAVVAEIERKKTELIEIGNTFSDKWACGSLDDILRFLNTLEVKEVDLDKHLKEDIEDTLFDLNGVAVIGATHYLTVDDVKEIAKHFFELGIKAAQKGEDV